MRRKQGSCRCGRGLVVWEKCIHVYTFDFVTKKDAALSCAQGSRFQEILLLLLA